MKFSGIFAFCMLTLLYRSGAWGFFGHQTANRMACFTLPPELFAFYKSNIDYLTIHAVDPDKRRYSDAEEPPRHFIDADHYGDCPFDTLPVNWKDAVEKFSEDSLKKYGIVPWYIRKMYSRLVNAMQRKDAEEILYYSANIGHYVADAHVPLHCSENYNGQLTGQTGIHGFWESRLPELFGQDYDYFTGRAIYISNVQEFAWRIVRESYSALDSVLSMEKKLNAETSPDQKYSFEQRGIQTVQVYSKEYSEKYHDRLSGQVERRLRSSVIDIGSIWYSAWIDAGMPDLEGKMVEQKREDTGGEEMQKDFH